MKLSEMFIDETSSVSMARVMIAAWTIMFAVIIFIFPSRATENLYKLMESILLASCAWAGGSRIAAHVGSSFGKYNTLEQPEDESTTSAEKG